MSNHGDVLTMEELEIKTSELQVEVLTAKQNLLRSKNDVRTQKKQLREKEADVATKSKNLEEAKARYDTFLEEHPEAIDFVDEEV